MEIESAPPAPSSVPPQLPPSRAVFYKGILETLAAGTAAGFFAEVVLYPIEGNLHAHLVLKPQPPNSLVPLSEPSLLSSNWRLDKFAVAKDLGKCLVQKVKTTSHDSTILCLFKHLAFPPQAPATGLMMAAYEYAKDVTKSRILPKDAGPITVGLVAGSLAHLLSTFISTPLSNLLSHQSHIAATLHTAPTTTSPLPSPALPHLHTHLVPPDTDLAKRARWTNVVREVVGQHGLRGLWKGFWTSVGGGVGYIAAFYALGDYFTNYYTAEHERAWYDERRRVRPAGGVVMGGGTAATASAHPISVGLPSSRELRDGPVTVTADMTTTTTTPTNTATATATGTDAELSPPPLPLSTLGLIGGLSATLAVVVSAPLELLRTKLVTEWEERRAGRTMVVASGSAGAGGTGVAPGATTASATSSSPPLTDRVLRMAPRGTGRKIFVTAIKRSWRTAFLSGSRRSVLGAERKLSSGALKAVVAAVRGFVKSGGLGRVLRTMGKSQGVRKGLGRVVEGCKGVIRGAVRGGAWRKVVARMVRVVVTRGRG
ncbi:hypothetical protein HDU93_001413 [Gonapodya sp. JEL0774]|nr:hypothetical protein HDU93_001413 [Gonapodya sp. JEL0774]